MAALDGVGSGTLLNSGAYLFRITVVEVPVGREVGRAAVQHPVPGEREPVQQKKKTNRAPGRFFNC